MSESLRGKVVLITGAARGIGAATARAVARRGARVALTGLEPERLAALAVEMGPAHAWFPCDVTDQASLDAAVKGAVAALGGIDVVVANAGIANNGTLAVNPPDAVARTLEVNLIGVSRTIGATLAALEARRGYYLLVSSAAAFRPIPRMAAYAASKVGVEYLGDALRLEVAHRGIGVGIAHPTWIDTDLVRDMKEDMPSFNVMLRRLPYPLNVVTSVEACAEAFARAIERRSDKIFVPEALRWVSALRWLISNPLLDRLLFPKDQIRASEEETRSLGRAFGKRSAAAP